MKQTKAGNGHYVELVLRILEGEFQGKKVWNRINIDNPSAKCVEIGCAQLAALGLALGIANLTTVQQLVNGVVIAHVKVDGEQNDVRTYSAAGQQPVQPPIQQNPGQFQPAQVAQPPLQQQQFQPSQVVQPPSQQQFQQVPPQQVVHSMYPPQPQQADTSQSAATGGTVPWARPQ